MSTEDPIGSDWDKGHSRSLSQKKHAKDGASWTPTESRERNQLMKQFCKNPEGVSGNSKQYRDNYDMIDWTK